MSSASKTIPQDIQKHSNNGCWSTQYLRNYIQKTLKSGGTLADIVKLDIGSYKRVDAKSEAMSDKIPIKIRPCKDGPFVPLKLYAKNDVLLGEPIDQQYKTGLLKVAKYTNPDLFETVGEGKSKEYRMRAGVQPTKEDCSATFFVVEKIQDYIEAEFARLIDEGVIAVPVQKKKGKDKDKKEKSGPEPKIMLRCVDDNLKVPVRNETKDGLVKANPAAYFKFNLDKETGKYGCAKAEDLTPDAKEREMVLTTDNIVSMLPSKTKLVRGMVSMSAINIYATGCSIAAYVDAIRVERPPEKKNVEFSDDEDSEVGDGDGDDEGDDDDDGENDAGGELDPDFE